jgi:phenylacetate-CoA ligase
MFRRFMFYLVHLTFKPRSIYYYLRFKSFEGSQLKSLREVQESKILDYLKFCKRYVPFYAERIPDIDGKSLRDLMAEIPVLSKIDIKSQPGMFLVDQIRPAPYKTSQTGGSTGEPLKFKISKDCDSAGLALLLRGFSRGGYQLGDKMAVLAGGSLIGKDKSFKGKFVAWAMVMRKYSSYGVDDAAFHIYCQDMKKWGAKFLRGYPSAIFELAKFVKHEEIDLSFVSVFTTAEMLDIKQREYIEEAFKAKVFDGYGLNDGGVTAFECDFHDGYHIDMERAYLEVVDKHGKPVSNKTGRIVATSFRNTSTPFIRYDTGDLGVLVNECCPCGSPYPLLKSLQGRVTDTLEVNGKIIGSPVLTVLMGHVNVNRYQFVQLSESHVNVIIEISEGYIQELEERYIYTSLSSQVGDFDIEFLYEEGFYISENGKHKIAVRQG